MNYWQRIEIYLGVISLIHCLFPFIIFLVIRELKIRNDLLKRRKTISTSEAIKKLTNELKKDSGYMYSWQSNIAMSFKDQAILDKRDWDNQETHDTANKASQYFLNLLCKD